MEAPSVNADGEKPDLNAAKKNESFSSCVPPFPAKRGDINNNHIDSTHWNLVNFRSGDITIGTYMKSGTTWMQQIVRNLLKDIPSDMQISDLSPWVDFRVKPIESIKSLEHQQHRRFMKHHLPFHNLRSSPDVCYIYIMRDGRDVVWSAYNHHKSETPLAYKYLNSGTFEGPKYPIFDEDALSTVEYFKRWLDRDGYPFWSFFDSISSWWEIRDHPNVLICHFAKMKQDLPGEVRRIYRFLKKHGDVIEGSEDNVVMNAVENSTFDYMRDKSNELFPGIDEFFKGGGKTFINKGTNGRWKNELPVELSERYEKMAIDKLGADCAQYLLTGVDPTGKI